MASHLDLEEQEQIDQLKHFWSAWGTLISSVLIVFFVGVGGWNGYQFWKNRQALQATALFDAVESAAQSGDEERLKQSFSDLRTKYPSTVQASQAGILVSKIEIEKGRMDAAISALEWVIEHSFDDGYKAVASLRLASLLIEKKSYDVALKHLENKFPVAFDGVIADRKGDLFAQQGKKQEAAKEYQRAYAIISPETEYRRLVEVKLNSFGIKIKSSSISNSVRVLQ